MTDFTLVDRVDSIAADLARPGYIAVDTEFMREKTFFAELCLVQIGTVDAIFCIDPLGDADMDLLWHAMMDTGWVVHSARQDIEVIYQAANRMPAKLFDTQIAAGLLGLAPQLGYAGLVSELFSVDIPKSHTRANWARRPLSDEVLLYAAEDVEYLLPARDILAEKLDKQGRLAWAEEDSAQLLNPALYDTDPKLSIKRLKGTRRLRGKRLAAAARLAAWRESEALRSNRPRQWILKDTVLVDIAGRMPSTPAELQQVEELPAGLIRRSGRQLLDVVAASGRDDDSHRPPASPSEEQKMLLKTMQKSVARCANELGLAAETVASKKDLAAIIIDGDRDSRLFAGWRRELVGESLLAML